MTFDLVADEDSFSALEGDWVRLHSSLSWRNPFTSFGWTRACYAEHRDAALYIVVARDDSRVVGIAPLMRAVRHGEDAIVFIGDTRADYLGFLAQTPAIEAALLSEVLLHRDACRLILCNLVQETSAMQQARPAVRINDAFRYVIAVRDRKPSWLRRAERKHRAWLRSGNTVECRSGAGAAAIIPEIVDVERRSWKGEADIMRFATIRQQAFLAAAFTGCSDVEAWLAWSPAGLVAYEIIFRLPDSVWFYQGAYLAEFSSSAPGNLLHAAAIEAGWADGTLQEYDFLSGREAYKTARTNVVRPMHRLTM